MIERMFDQPIQLTPAQFKFYEDTGYLVVENALSHSECDKALEVLEYHAKKSGNKNYAAVMNLDRPEEWRHVYGQNDHWIHRYVRQMLVKHPVLVTVLETLHQKKPGEVVLMQTMVLYKKAGSDYAGQAWNPHQDGCYHGAPFGTTLSANIAFTDHDRENGCLFMFPGSHKEGRFFEAVETSSYREKPGQKPGHDISASLPEKYKSRVVDLNLKKGSLFIFHGGVAHGSHPNVSDRDRTTFSAPYKIVGAPFSTGHGISKRMEIPVR